MHSHADSAIQATEITASGLPSLDLLTSKGVRLRRDGRFCAQRPPGHFSDHRESMRISVWNLASP